VSIPRVHARILIVGAWLAGAGIATAGSLYAVSLLGQGIIGPSGHQLNVAAVNRALADDTTDPSGRGTPSSPTASPTPATSPSPAASPTPRHTPDKSSGTLLTSRGGNVVASCQPGGAYLLSWSPQQGYQTAAVLRGPAAQAQVTFRSSQIEVNLVVTCHGTVASGSASVDNSWGDDGE